MSGTRRRRPFPDSRKKQDQEPYVEKRVANNINNFHMKFLNGTGAQPIGRDDSEYWQRSSFNHLYRMFLLAGSLSPIYMYEYPFLLAKWIGGKG
eukprot:9263653-Pyramimonas_sp.AAC.1